ALCVRTAIGPVSALAAVSAAARAAISSVRPAPARPRTRVGPAPSVAVSFPSPGVVSAIPTTVARGGNSIRGVETPIDWLDVCRRASARQSDLFAASVTIAERTVYQGRGEGGDMTLELDRRCEDIVF